MEIVFFALGDRVVDEEAQNSRSLKLLLTRLEILLNILHTYFLQDFIESSNLGNSRLGLKQINPNFLVKSSNCFVEEWIGQPIACDLASC